MPSTTATMTAHSVAPIFLTRPFLHLGISTTTVKSITVFLESFFAVTGGNSQLLDIQASELPSIAEITATCDAKTTALIKSFFGSATFAPTTLVKGSTLVVPVPLALACHYFGIAWNDWFLALGGSRFKLVLKPMSVYVVKEVDGCIGVVWSRQPALPSSSVTPAGVNDVDDNDANSSRPSSRSSNYSSFSFSSRSSHSSVSSISSATSFTKPAPRFSVTAVTPTRASFTTSSRPLAPITKTPRATPKTTSTASKYTKYVYEGGVSTVLTGGVMLGNPSSKARSTSSTPVPQAPALQKPSRSPSPLCTSAFPPLPKSTTKVRDPTGPIVGGPWRRVNVNILA